MNSSPSAPAANTAKRASRFTREILTPSISALAPAAAISLAAIIAAFLVPAELARYAAIIPAMAALVSIFILWSRLGPTIRMAIEQADDFAPLAVEERVFAAVETKADGTKKRKTGAVSLAYTDALTGLGNKMRMEEKFNRLVESRKDDPAAFTIGLMNLDGMKPINDLFGFAGGNEVIKQCAIRLAAAVDGDGFVCRYGGDEFAFIFPFVIDEKGASEKGRLLQSVLAAPFDLEGSTVRLSGSFGFAIHPYAGDSIESVMGNIDTALYHSKRHGRGRVTIYSRELEDMVRENARIEQALRNAVANNDVTPHFQPIISLQDGKLLGFESLARWIDPELGFVSPAKFIPLAEERGIIAALTESLLLQAARAAAEWPQDLFLSFNLSSIQLVDPATAQNIKEIIGRAGLPPHRLEIEVTETAMMSDPETASMVIDELHKCGIRISMDDFGTGQSSLGRLRELKLDKVKIDRAFIMAIGEDKPAEHIVRAILEMCAGLELTVVAEGIEEIRQAESLKRYGCHAGQGYLFGKPQDARKTLGYIRDFLRDGSPVTLAQAV